MAQTLEQLRPFVRNGEHLRTGRALSSIELRSREILGTWLLCAVANHAVHSERFLPASDPTGGDGTIQDLQFGTAHATEHVIVLGRYDTGDGGPAAGILDAVDKKIKKGGRAYATGKTLVVFVDGGDRLWYPNVVARSLPNPLLFDAVWVVALQRVENEGYVYGVTRLDPANGSAPTWLVQIEPDFRQWDVTPVQ